MSASKTILVAGATGNQGEGVTKHCLDRGLRVVALVRNPETDAAQRLKALGAELCKADFNDVKSLRQATEKVDAVFFMEVETGDPPADFQRARNVAEAAKASPTVSTVILSSSIKTGQHESFPGWGPDYPMYRYWLQKHDLENLIRNGGFKQWTIVRPGHYLQNLRAPINSISFPGLVDDFTLRVAWKPETKLPFLDAGDVGLVVAEAVLDPGAYSGKEIEMAAEAVTVQQLADKMTAEIGKPFKVHYYSDSELAQISKLSPMPGSHRWANEVPGEGAELAAKTYRMSSINKFLAENKFRIIPADKF